MKRYGERPFPAYRYVPGRTPHPLRDPDGHSAGTGHRPPPVPLDPDAWSASADYLHGIDLFNHGYYWEAHEALEGLWVAAGRETPLGRGLQGLIQIAVGQLKRLQGHGTGARLLSTEGCAKLPGGPGPWLGIDVVRLRADVAAALADPAAPAPRIVLSPPGA